MVKFKFTTVPSVVALGRRYQHLWTILHRGRGRTPFSPWRSWSGRAATTSRVGNRSSSCSWTIMLPLMSGFPPKDCASEQKQMGWQHQGRSVDISGIMEYVKSSVLGCCCEASRIFKSTNCINLLWCPHNLCSRRTIFDLMPMNLEALTLTWNLNRLGCKQPLYQSAPMHAPMVGRLQKQIKIEGSSQFPAPGGWSQ